MRKSEEKCCMGVRAASVHNLENVEELVADGSVVAGAAFIEESKQKHAETENQRRLAKTSVEDEANEKISFYFYPSGSLLKTLTEKQNLIQRRSPMTQGDTIMRTTRGRRSDLGSVGPRCFSWAGPGLDREDKVDENWLTCLAGRKGGMV